MKDNKRPYSKIQYFLWLISGSEISALKNCPNDYNRHANIGLMILITAIFAGITAFIAASTFVDDHYFGISAFALIWAFLIFSLDRSMVNSIKKDPNMGENFMWSYFTPRLVLAIILAFFMSIPLDHIVFREKIFYYMEKNKTADVLNRKNELSVFYDTKQIETNYINLNEQSGRLDEEIKSQCPLPEYENKMKDYNYCSQQLPGLDNERKARKADMDNYYKQLQRIQDTIIPKTDAQYNSLYRSYNTANQTYSNKRAECNRLKNEADAIDRAWRNGKRQEKKTIDSLAMITLTEQRAVNDSITTKSELYEKDLRGLTGFDTQFVTLFLMPNWGVQILKWLIFLALLVIEILPTFLKIKTPIGQYDWEMYKRDRETALESQIRFEKLRMAMDKIEEYRGKEEIMLNKRIIDKVVIIEEKLANEMLDEWELKAQEEVNRRVDNANKLNQIS